MNNIAPNQPFYLYQQPMFALTVSTVLVVDNGVLLIKDNGVYRFPSGIVRAGQETLQFAAVRHVKEQTAITLKKNALIPVDFRSEPERSPEKNVIDIGFACVVTDLLVDLHSYGNVKWEEVDFEKRCLVNKAPFYMDHELLLDRALEIVIMMKE